MRRTRLRVDINQAAGDAAARQFLHQLHTAPNSHWRKLNIYSSLETFGRLANRSEQAAPGLADVRRVEVGAFEGHVDRCILDLGIGATHYPGHRYTSFG